MQKLLSECVQWLNWKGGVVLAIALLWFVFLAERTTWRLWLGATPLLAIAACVLPCLIPLAWLWRKNVDTNANKIK